MASKRIAIIARFASSCSMFCGSDFRVALGRWPVVSSDFFAGLKMGCSWLFENFRL